LDVFEHRIGFIDAFFVEDSSLVMNAWFSGQGQ
jgi:hypothetical protein